MCVRRICRERHSLRAAGYSPVSTLRRQRGGDHRPRARRPVLGLHDRERVPPQADRSARRASAVLAQLGYGNHAAPQIHPRRLRRCPPRRSPLLRSRRRPGRARHAGRGFTRRPSGHRQLLPGTRRATGARALDLARRRGGSWQRAAGRALRCHVARALCGRPGHRREGDHARTPTFRCRRRRPAWVRTAW